MLPLPKGWGTVSTVVHVVPSVVRLTTNRVSVIELSFQVSLTSWPTTLPFLSSTLTKVEANPSGLIGGSASDTGRIMSISSWLRMWQCQTYSQPKLTSVRDRRRERVALGVDVDEHRVRGRAASSG